MAEDVFDQKHYQAITKSRQAFLEKLLSQPLSHTGISTALDLGCGLGDFSGYLADKGFAVVGVDGRADNVKEAAHRHPSIKFMVADVQELNLSLGTFDLVLSFGLLYHLENPFQAVRNTRAATRHIAVIETQVAPESGPIARLRQEATGVDQGLTDVALVPSRAALITMLYRSGFSNVYGTTIVPDHEDFHKRRRTPAKRTTVVASMGELTSPLLVKEEVPRIPNMWEPSKRSFLRSLLRLLHR